jgi:hypothetical protein
MRNPDATRFLFRLTGLLPLAAALVLMDWISFQPPVRRHFTATLDAAAHALVSGKTIWSDADMHELKPVWIEHLSGPREVLVLGSSRLLQVPQEWFQPRGVLNASMFAGDLADSVSIFQLCLETGKTPRLVLLDLNPTLALEGKPRVSPALAMPYRRALLRYGIFPPAVVSELFLLDGFRWDLKTFLPHPVWGISQEMAPDAYRMRPDGSADWGGTESGATPDEVERSVTVSMRGLDANYRHWRTTSQPGWFDLRIFRDFLDDLQARHVRVVVMLVPLHPVAYDFYARQGGYDETWIRREMAARGIGVIGSYSPSVAGATRADFFDDVHAHASLIHRLLREGGIIQ